MSLVKKALLARKFNPNHGPDGQFASAPGATTKDKVAASFKVDETQSGHHAFHVRDDKGNHVGMVADTAVVGAKPAWLAYHDSEGSVTHEVPDTSSYVPRGGTKEMPSYRDTKEEALDDLATMHTSHLNKAKQYAADDAKAKKVEGLGTVRFLQP